MNKKNDERGHRKFHKSFFVPAIFTFAAFVFWLKYSAGQKYWWIISIMFIFAGHYYFYYIKKEDY